MDLESTVSTIASNISDNLQHVIRGASDYIPDEISDMIRHAYIYFPKNIDLVDAFQFILYFAASTLILGIISRVVLGKRSSLNHSLSTVMAIGSVYAATVVIYTFRLWELQNFLTPLPFVSFSSDYLILYPIADMELGPMCQQLLSMIILAFLVTIIDSLIPRPENPLGWYLLRFIGVLLSMGLHYFVTRLIHIYLPDILVNYASVILLFLLVFMLFSGILSLILGLVIAVANPFLGAMYTFFFSSIVGKQLSKAIFSSCILCGIFYLLDILGYTVICISSTALLAFIPLVVVLLILWYLIGHVL